MELRNQIVDFGQAFGYRAIEIFEALREARALLAGPVRALPVLAALIASPTLAGEVKASACFEHGGEHVRLVDAEGKRHRYAVFALADSSDMELSEFSRSRKVVAMTDGAILHIKQGKDERGEMVFAKMGPIEECPTRKASFPKL